MYGSFGDKIPHKRARFGIQRVQFIVAASYKNRIYSFG
jgi:hypothetical protein